MDNISNSLKHIAIIMDGNGRWAKQLKMPRIFGHRSSISSVDSSIEYCVENAIENLTLFALGRDNFNRPESELNSLFELFYKTLDSKKKKLYETGVKLEVVGDRSRLPQYLVDKIVEVESHTSSNSALNLYLAIDYSGRWDILNAIKIANSKNQDLDNLVYEEFERYLVCGGKPIDLLIRTSGEVRVSDFMLWQLAYSEMYFTKVKWPDFSKKEMSKAVDSYLSRDRRYGKV